VHSGGLTNSTVEMCFGECGLARGLARGLLWLASMCGCTELYANMAGIATGHGVGLCAGWRCGRIFCY
jgi:hypothetical protein